MLLYGAEVWAPQLIAAGNACMATRVHPDFLRSLLGVRRSTPELVVLAEAAQLVRWRTRLARIWISIIAAAEGTLLRCALADNCAGGGDGRRGHCTPPLGWADGTCLGQCGWGGQPDGSQPLAPSGCEAP